MTYGEDDLTSNERARLGISFADRVYILKNSVGDVVAVKVIDPSQNKESVIDMKTALTREGHATTLEIVKMVYQGMKKLPSNYAVHMGPDGVLSRGYRDGISGYSPEKAAEKNGKGVSLAVGNVASLASSVGERKRVSADAYGPGDFSGSYAFIGSFAYSGQVLDGGYGKGPKQADKSPATGVESGKDTEKQRGSKQEKKKNPSEEDDRVSRSDDLLELLALFTALSEESEKVPPGDSPREGELPRNPSEEADLVLETVSIPVFTRSGLEAVV